MQKYEDVATFKQLYDLINQEYFDGELKPAEIKIKAAQRNSKNSRFVIDPITGNSRIEINGYFIDLLNNKPPLEILERYAVELTCNMIMQLKYQSNISDTIKDESIIFPYDEEMTKYGITISMKSGKVNGYSANNKLLEILI